MVSTQFIFISSHSNEMCYRAVKLRYYNLIVFTIFTIGMPLWCQSVYQFESSMHVFILLRLMVSIMMNKIETPHSFVMEFYQLNNWMQLTGCLRDDLSKPEYNEIKQSLYDIKVSDNMMFRIGIRAMSHIRKWDDNSSFQIKFWIDTI